jgi:hypothetical protein
MISILGEFKLHSPIFPTLVNGFSNKEFHLPIVMNFAMLKVFRM